MTHSQRPRALGLTVVAITFFGARAAAAEPAPVWQEAAPERPAPTKSYGHYIVLADLASVATLVGSAAAESGWLATAAVGGYVLAGPIIHLEHDNPTGAGASLALRLSLPVAGGFLGYQIEVAGCGPDEWFCGLGGLALGTLVGMATATIVDSVVLARMPVQRDARVARAPALSPTLAMSRNGEVAFGLSGRF